MASDDYEQVFFIVLGLAAAVRFLANSAPHMSPVDGPARRLKLVQSVRRVGPLLLVQVIQIPLGLDLLHGYRFHAVSKSPFYISFDPKRKKEKALK